MTDDMPDNSSHDEDETLSFGGGNDSSELAPGSWIGPYRLEKKIGAGGMGVVWDAQQVHPVKRRVAVKVIRLEGNSREIVRRFEAERQALALMNHPNIARIIDGGTTPQGLPFFAMEFVEGLSLIEYCDQNRLSIDARLRLFLDVCSGVHHAHQKGIIHRDLKPTNILVASVDDRPVVKVIDFGLAKATEANHYLSDISLQTEFGQVLGTLKYMSPEQANVDNADIDTRADVYALGIILYELLTSRTPVEPDAIRDQALIQVMDYLRSLEPIKPSSRLSHISPENQKEITTRRQTDSLHLQRILEGDLDWIVMKALERDRQRRYDSAAGFASDVQRFLSHEPVIARPPSITYRLSKFIKKHRLLVSSATLITAALFIGLALATWGYVNASLARDEAETIAQKERAQARALSETTKELEQTLVSSWLSQGRLAAKKDPVTAGHYFLRAAELDSAQDAAKRYASQVNESLNLQSIVSHDDHTTFGEFSKLSPNKILTWGYDRKAVIWDLKDPNRSRVFRVDSECIDAVVFDEETKLAVQSVNQLFVWDLESPGESPIHTVDLSYGSAFSLVNERYLFTAEAKDERLVGELRDLDSNTVVETFSDPTDDYRFLISENYLAIQNPYSDDEIANGWRVIKAPDNESRRKFIDTTLKRTNSNEQLISRPDSLIEFDSESTITCWSIPELKPKWQYEIEGSISAIDVFEEWNHVVIRTQEQVTVLTLIEGDLTANFPLEASQWIVGFASRDLFVHSDGLKMRMSKITPYQTCEEVQLNFSIDWPMAFDKNGTYLAAAIANPSSALRPTSVCVIDLESLEPLGQLTHHTGISDVLFDSVGSRLMTCGMTSRVWDIVPTNRATQYRLSEEPTITLSDSGESSHQLRIRSSKIPSGETTQFQNWGIETGNNHVCWAPYGPLAMTGVDASSAYIANWIDTEDVSKGVSVVNALTSEVIGPLKLSFPKPQDDYYGATTPDSSANQARFSPDGNGLGLANYNRVGLWWLPDESPFFEKEYSQGLVTDCVWSRDGEFIAIANLDGLIEIISRSKRNVVASYRHEAELQLVDSDTPLAVRHQVFGLLWTANMELISWSADGSILAYRLESSQLRTLHTNPNLISEGLYVPDEEKFIFNAANLAYAIRLSEPQELSTLDLPEVSQIELANPKYAAFVGDDRITFVDVEQFKIKNQIVLDSRIRTHHFSDTGEWVLVTLDDGRTQLWNGPSEIRIKEFATTGEFLFLSNDSIVEVEGSTLRYRNLSLREELDEQSLSEFELKTGTFLDDQGNLKSLTPSEFQSRE